MTNIDGVNEEMIAKALVKTLADRQTVKGTAAIKGKGLDLASVAQRLISIYNEVLDKHNTK